MAEVVWKQVEAKSAYIVYRAENIGSGDTVAPLRFHNFPDDISVHVHGTFGGATMQLRARNTPVGSGVPAADLGGASIAATAESLFSIRERPLYIQPVFSGGDGSQAATIDVVVWA